MPAENESNAFLLLLPASDVLMNEPSFGIFVISRMPKTVMSISVATVPGGGGGVAGGLGVEGGGLGPMMPEETRSIKILLLLPPGLVSSVTANWPAFSRLMMASIWEASPVHMGFRAGSTTALFTSTKLML